MKALLASVEVAPFAKVGGLADVAASLPKALKSNGHDVRVVMPAYGMILDDHRWPKTRLGEFEVRLNPGWSEPVEIIQTSLDGIPVYLLGSERWFGHVRSSEEVYSPGVEQYLYFSEACLALSEQIGWRPDVVHANDWHTGAIPLLMREKHRAEFEETAAVYTIHNFAYQGEFGPEILDALGLDRGLFRPDATEAFGAFNFLKTGCIFADRVNTVSPNYAQEIQTDEFGGRLAALMAWLSKNGRLSGILNGIDTQVFDPGSDPHIAHPFSTASPIGKAECRKALLGKLEVPDEASVPLAGVVSRLSEQKGLDILADLIEQTEMLPFRLVVQGLGDSGLVARFRALEKRFPDHVRLVEAFDPIFAQQVYAGSDLFLMPSRFEPCGLGQMIALRYGAIPIVRKTGGLADTIDDEVNGFIFDASTAEALRGSIDRACTAYNSQDRWKGFLERALASDFSWGVRATQYVDLYEEALATRNSGSLAAQRAV